MELRNHLFLLILCGNGKSRYKLFNTIPIFHICNIRFPSFRLACAGGFSAKYEWNLFIPWSKTRILNIMIYTSLTMNVEFSRNSF